MTNPIEPSARDLVAAVRHHVEQAMQDLLRMRMQSGEAATNAYAAACMEELPLRLAMLVKAHDALGTALNAGSPDAPPVLSLDTEEPA